MNEIVVVMDFSSSSKYMLDFAAKIANTYNSFITIVWIDNKENRKLLNINSDKQVKELIVEQYDKAISKFSYIISVSQFELRLVTDNSYSKLLSLVYNLQINLLLIHNKQKKGFISETFNTNLNIQSNVSCPVIFFPDSYVYDSTISNIFIPIDQSIDTRQKLPISLILSKSFASNAKICSMKLDMEKQLIAKYAQQALNYLHKNKINVEAVEIANNIKEIESYCVNKKIALIISMRDNAIDSALSRYSFTQKLINMQLIPVLSFPNATVKRKALGK